MSGVKQVDLEEEARARARALEQAAREREARLQKAALQGLGRACEEGQRLIDRLEKSGAGELGRFLRAELAQARAMLGGEVPVSALEQRTAGVRAEQEQVGRMATFLEQVPNGPARRALLRSLETAASSAEQTAKLGVWSRNADGLASIETALAELTQVSQFLRACQTALVPLSRQEQDGLATVEAFLGAADADSLAARAAAAKLLRTLALREQLEAREQQLLSSLVQLRTPSWQERIGSWRPELGQQLAMLAGHVRMGEWTRAAPLLRELEDFFKAYTRHRVEVLCEGARAAGLQTTVIKFDAALHAYHAQINDEHGHFANVTEFVPDWRNGLENGRLQLEGPSSFDGPTCMREGFESLFEEVRRNGHQIRRVEGSRGEVLYEEQQASAPVDVTAVPGAGSAAKKPMRKGIAQ